MGAVGLSDEESRAQGSKEPLASAGRGQADLKVPTGKQRGGAAPVLTQGLPSVAAQVGGS